LQQIEKLWLMLKRRETRHTGLYLRFLAKRNRQTTSSVVAPGGPVLSLTSYGVRLQSVYYTIESIAAGSILPSRFLLWVDDERAYRSLPETLKRLEGRGLEIGLTDNLGPHTKYFPSLQAMDHLQQPLVTADDDVLYSRHWLAGLLHAHRQDPDVLHCYRAHVVHLEQGRIAPYTRWTSCTSDRPSFLHFATAVSGNILPPRLLQRLKQEGLAFRNLCPKADDIWLHVNALRCGIRIRQLSTWQRNYPLLPGTQEVTLSSSNVNMSANDAQIAKTYGADDYMLLEREQNSRDSAES
jgi:hypothetical protein